MKPRNDTFTFTASPYSLSNVCISQDTKTFIGLSNLPLGKAVYLCIHCFSVVVKYWPHGLVFLFWGLMTFCVTFCMAQVNLSFSKCLTSSEHSFYTEIAICRATYCRNVFRCHTWVEVGGYCLNDFDATEKLYIFRIYFWLVDLINPPRTSVGHIW